MKAEIYLFVLSLIYFSCANEVDSIVENSTNSQYPEEETTGNSTEIDLENSVFIYFSNEIVSVENSFEEEEVNVINDDGHVIVRSSVTDKVINYIVSGSTNDGSLKFYGDYKYNLVLNGVEITNPAGAAINNQCSKKLTVFLNDGTVNRLTDGDTYTFVSGEDMKGTFFSEGQIHFYGKGDMEIIGKNKHALCVDDYLHIHEGNITVVQAAGDAVHVNDYIQIDAGNLTTFSTKEGLDCENGFVEINGGNISISTTGEKAHGIKSLTTIVINEDSEEGGEQNGGDNNGEDKGEDDFTGIYYPKLRSSGEEAVSSTSISIRVSGKASKGLKAGSDITVHKGSIAITTTGDAFYDTTDAAISSCAGIKCDGNLLIEDGAITITSSGSGGKGINADGTFTMNGGYVEVTTTGSQFTYGKDNTAAKAIKCDMDMVINDGKIVIHTSGKEAEGLESKSQLYIHGGDIYVEAYDDCINASKHIELTGGDIYCYSKSNDGIDSNGTLTISGGRIISSGATAPEEGFDCDNNRFSITGGYVIGLGGATSSPTTSACTQHSLIYSVSSSPQIIRIQSDSGEEALTFKLPRSYSGQMTLLFSSPLLKGSTKYTIYTGGSISGEDDFYGLYTDAEYTPGTTASTFTTSSMVTTIGSSGGGPGGGPGGRPW
ncbi:carbohydrate-binding domain-containing protein [Bacteroidales bacterium OttesenSCG-928-M06]|nr:carbohydrate-binding domain-containing protein [Bacteroidales bacterium OttesenSCG-928-M06]